MRHCYFFISLLVGSSAATTFSLQKRDTVVKCTDTDSKGNGTCEATGSKCRGITSTSSLCAEGSQCCTEIACKVGAGHGFCRSVANNGCADGNFNPGYCPGSSDIQCCIPDNSIPPVYGDVGQLVLKKAMEADGIPYAWAGGNCNGPTGDQPPYDYGDIGFDCSGLVCWALCEITGRNLFREGLRVTRSMYCASEETLGYKRYPLEERIVGDAVFFGDACDCVNNPDGIHHVALSMDGTASERLWNAPNDRVKKVQINNISDFADTPCPWVIRFTDYLP